MWRGSLEACPHQPAPPCLPKMLMWMRMNLTWRVSCYHEFAFGGGLLFYFLFLSFMPHIIEKPVHLRVFDQALFIFYLFFQVKWMRRWRRSFHSTCSPEPALVPVLLLCPLPAVVPVPHPPTGNPLLPAGPVVPNNPPDHHKVKFTTQNCITLYCFYFAKSPL